jgi:hypothetical protein
LAPSLAISSASIREKDHLACAAPGLAAEPVASTGHLFSDLPWDAVLVELLDVTR